MIFNKYSAEGKAKIIFSVYKRNSADEYNLMITPVMGLSAPDHYEQIEQSLSGFINSHRIQNPLVVFKKFFASDICNQKDLIILQGKENQEAAVSVIQQPSLNGNKLVSWVYLISFHSGIPENGPRENGFSFKHNGYTHLYTTGLVSVDPKDSYHQTLGLFEKYLSILQGEALTLKDNCFRTWIYVRDIDNNYQGMVKARNVIFEQEGLTNLTHFIASTGIEGQNPEIHNLVGMDAYAAGGLSASQVKFLKAASHLSPTHVYGVAFERGTAIDYGDRRHILISGTASIDHRGHVLYPGDIENQTCRVFENISALLAEAGASFQDVSSMIVYLRDPGDQRFINDFLIRKYQGIPFLVVFAPICRHNWLIEVECNAIITVNNTAYRDF